VHLECAAQQQVAHDGIKMQRECSNLELHPLLRATAGHVPRVKCGHVHVEQIFGGKLGEQPLDALSLGKGRVKPLQQQPADGSRRSAEHLCLRLAILNLGHLACMHG